MDRGREEVLYTEMQIVYVYLVFYSQHDCASIQLIRTIHVCQNCLLISIPSIFLHSAAALAFLALYAKSVYGRSSHPTHVERQYFACFTGFTYTAPLVLASLTEISLLQNGAPFTSMLKCSTQLQQK